MGGSQASLAMLEGIDLKQVEFIPFVVVDIFESGSAHKPRHDSHNYHTAHRGQLSMRDGTQRLSAENAIEHAEHDVCEIIQNSYNHRTVVAKDESSVDEGSKAVLLPVNSNIGRDCSP